MVWSIGRLQTKGSKVECSSLDLQGCCTPLPLDSLVLQVERVRQSPLRSVSTASRQRPCFVSHSRPATSTSTSPFRCLDQTDGSTHSALTPRIGPDPSQPSGSLHSRDTDGCHRSVRGPSRAILSVRHAHVLDGCRLLADRHASF
jgi:hypothetical protein